MAGDGSASSIENAAELERGNKEKHNAWVQGANGPAEHAAALEALRGAEAPPAAPAAAPPAPPAAPAAPAAAAPPAPPVAPAPGASAAAVVEFIDALIDEAGTQKLQIPATARIPLEVNGEIQYVTAAELRKRGMLEADYRLKTEEVGNARRELEEHAGRLIADRARMEAREQWIADERKRLQEAQKSPEAWERYQNHLRLLQDDPEYAKTFDDALKGREMAAEDAAEAAARHRELVGEGIAAAATWMLELAAQPAYAHVDLDRVRELYARDLETGKATLDRGYVERIFQAEADQAHRAVGPLEARIAELSAQVAALQGQTDAAAAHNRTTQHAIDRGAAPPVNTGLPAAPGPADRKVRPFTPRELPEVNREWAARRD